MNQLTSCSQQITEYYVSPNGNDQHSGRLPVLAADGQDGPLATIVAARDAIRRDCASHRGPVVVTIADGMYPLDAPLYFGPEDSGSPESPIAYVAATGAAPVVSGGQRICAWLEGEHLGQRCWHAALPEVAAGAWYFTQLFINGQARPRPRLPRDGYYHFTGLAGFPNCGINWHLGPDKANYAVDEIRAWQNLADIELISYQLWFDTHHRIKALDEETQTVFFHQPSLGNLRDERNEFARYFLENVFEALDTPGQWYLDRPNGQLFYLPLPGETLEQSVIIAPRLERLLILRGDGAERPVSHLLFSGLTFAHQQWALPDTCAGFIQAAAGVPGAVLLDAGARDCVFYRCTVTQVNGYGVEMQAGSTANTIAACTIEQTGGGGIKIAHEELLHDAADQQKFAALPGQPPIAAVVADCTIRDFGQLFPSAIGVWLGNSGWNLLYHNEITEGNYTGISSGWTWGYAETRTLGNRIEANHIHQINMRELLSDNGGIYLLGRQPGGIVRDNVIHDISCYGYGGFGIYLDEGSSEQMVERNLTYHTRTSGFFIHYGRDNLVRHNIFAGSREDHMAFAKREMHRSAVVEQNIFYPANGQFGGNLGGHHTWSPAHTTIHRNLIHTIDGSPLSFYGLSLEALQAQGQLVETIQADPGFRDPTQGDFMLAADSPAHSLGITPCEARAAGPRAQIWPADYADYLRQYPLPARARPIVHTKITLTRPAPDAGIDAETTYAVTVTNLGTEAATGVLHLSAGPAEAIVSAVDQTVPFSLAPGASICQPVAITVAGTATQWWLDSRGEGDAIIPARCLWHRGARWEAPLLTDVEDPAQLPALLAPLPARPIHLLDRLLAEVTLACTSQGMLYYAKFYEPHLHPNFQAPWLGTGLELLAIFPPEDTAPANAQPRKRQICLVPRADGAAADGLAVDADGQSVTPAAAVHTWAHPTDRGCEISAIIPWMLLGFPEKPSDFAMEMIVDVWNPDTERMIQVPMFDLPWQGCSRLYCRLICGA